MDLIGALQSITILFVVKVMLIMLLGVYAVFAGLMMRQISAMVKAVTIRDEFIIRALGIGHFVFAIIMFLLTIIIL